MPSNSHTNTVVFLTALPTRQDGVENRDKDYGGRKFSEMKVQKNMSSKFPKISRKDLLYTKMLKNGHREFDHSVT